MIRRALISVDDKSGLVELGQALVEQGIEIISTGGTAKMLKENGIPVTPIELVTGFPEMLGGRVKTLHPMVHGGILARRHVESDEQDLGKHGIVKIELVVSNLYPFEKTIARTSVTLEEAIEKIDIGGVALHRAAAKNFHDVAVLTDPADYGEAIHLLRTKGEIPYEVRASWAVKAFRATAHYDTAISTYLGNTMAGDSAIPFPPRFTLSASKSEDMRYGENPHQQGALYAMKGMGGLANAEQLHGKGMSYTNWLDAEGAWGAVESFDAPTIVIVKHASPCGIATNQSLARAWEDALASDPVSAFGGVVALNRTVDLETATAIDSIFTEIILAPAFDEAALSLLRQKKNRRLLRVPPLTGADTEVHAIPGGFIVQDRDKVESVIQMTTMSEREPTNAEKAVLDFAWRAVVAVKSNAIVFARATEGGYATVGIGAGQPNRVHSVGLAVQKSGENAKGAVMASDAFFPFADGVETAIAAGITAIIQPGGSVRDEEVIVVANTANVAMVATGVRHFRH
jgi:phosphoribosylaminoimidazolecarboxamide formyltransferase / IMP cyclohydrolase